VVTLTSVDLDFYALHPSVRRIALGLAGDSTHILQAVWANLRRLVALRRVLREQQPDVVLGMMTTAAVLAVLANVRLSGKVVASEHIHPPRLPVGPLWDRLRRRSYPLAARVAVLTDESRQWVQTHVPGCRVVVIPNAVPFPLQITELVLLPERVVAEHRRLVLAVGRLAEQKGFDLLIEAFAGLAAVYADWDLVILGEGPKRLDLEARVAALGLSHRVKLPGRTGNLTDWYRRADLYVMSSRFEGFGLTLAEAMAYGCPAVSFDCDTGPRDIIRDGVDGLLVRPVGDVKALTAVLGQLMDDGATRRQMAERAIEVRERFSMARILAMWDQVFEEVLHDAAS
jgi:glycosyltransferase involved in cell wall biosynthesis